jgi:hypothetical protein
METIGSQDRCAKGRDMSTSFKDFLRERAEKYQAELRAGKAGVEEWRSAVERLFDQLRAWLTESDPERTIFEVKTNKQEITEPGLGHYRIPRLDIHAFGKWIGIIPKARKTVGRATPPQTSAPTRAAGRVDITDEIRRYVLYRYSEDGRDAWVIDDLESEPSRLDQAAFEKALKSYLE